MPYELIRNSLGEELFDPLAPDLLDRLLPAEVQATDLSLAEKGVLPASLHELTSQAG